MSSPPIPSLSPYPSAIFTHSWIITIPTHPTLKFHRVTPALMDTYLSIMTDPANHPFASDGVKAVVWDAAKLAADKERMIQAYIDSPQKKNVLVLLVQCDGEWVGYGAVTGYGSEGMASVGLQVCVLSLSYSMNHSSHHPTQRELLQLPQTKLT